MVQSLEDFRSRQGCRQYGGLIFSAKLAYKPFEKPVLYYLRSKSESASFRNPLVQLLLYDPIPRTSAAQGWAKPPHHQSEDIETQTLRAPGYRSTPAFARILGV